MPFLSRSPRQAVRSVVAALLLAGSGGGVLSQETDDSRYDGTWAAQTSCEGQAECRFRLVLADFGGTWQDVSPGRAAQRICQGRKMPLTVQRSTEKRLAFTVWGDSVAAGCPQLTVIVRPVAERQLHGTMERGVQDTETPEEHAAHAPQAFAGRPELPKPARAGAVAVRMIRR